MHVNGCLPKPKCLPFERGQFLLWHNNCRYKRKLFDLLKHVTVRISVSVWESFHCSEYDWVRTYWRPRSFSALKTARLRNRNIKVGGWVQKVMVIRLADCFQVALAKLNVAHQLVAIQKWQNSQNKRFGCCWKWKSKVFSAFQFFRHF